jgi:hypothetical protein
MVYLFVISEEKGMVVILSREIASRCKAVSESKDPYELGGRKELLVFED